MNRRVGYLWVAATLLLVGCGPSSTVVERATNPPEFAIVTATPRKPATPFPIPIGGYPVAEGDTLSTIAERFGVTELAIMETNGLGDGNLLSIGQVLLIPTPVGNKATPGSR